MVSIFQCHKEKQEKGGLPSEMQIVVFQLYVYILSIANTEKYCHSWAYFIASSAKHPVNASNKQLLISAPQDWGDLTCLVLFFLYFLIFFSTQWVTNDSNQNMMQLIQMCICVFQ